MVVIAGIFVLQEEATPPPDRGKLYRQFNSSSAGTGVRAPGTRRIKYFQINKIEEVR